MMCLIIWPGGDRPGGCAMCGHIRHVCDLREGHRGPHKDSYGCVPCACGARSLQADGERVWVDSTADGKRMGHTPSHCVDLLSLEVRDANGSTGKTLGQFAVVVVA